MGLVGEAIERKSWLPSGKRQEMCARRHADAPIKTLVPAKAPNSMDLKIGETHAIVQYLLWCPAVWENQAAQNIMLLLPL